MLEQLGLDSDTKKFTQEAMCSISVGYWEKLFKSLQDLEVTKFINGGEPSNATQFLAKVQAIKEIGNIFVETVKKKSKNNS
jgi:hypothetical protein